LELLGTFSLPRELGIDLCLNLFQSDAVPRARSLVEKPLKAHAITEDLRFSLEIVGLRRKELLTLRNRAKSMACVK